MLTQERLKEFLRYDNTSGEFFWLKRKKTTTDFNRPAGTLNDSGYTIIGIDAVRYRAHRLAWFYIYGVWPNGEIDHINGVRGDNRIENLREATRTLNGQNLRVARCITGFMGVYKVKSGKFGSSIKACNVRYWIGTFDTPELARDAYLMAKRKLHEGCTI